MKQQAVFKLAMIKKNLRLFQMFIHFFMTGSTTEELICDLYENIANCFDFFKIYY